MMEPSGRMCTMLCQFVSAEVTSHFTDSVRHFEWGCLSPSLSTEILCESPKTCKHAATAQKHDSRKNQKLGIRNRGETHSSVILQLSPAPTCNAPVFCLDIGWGGHSVLPWGNQAIRCSNGQFLVLFFSLFHYLIFIFFVGWKGVLEF